MRFEQHSTSGTARLLTMNIGGPSLDRALRMSRYLLELDLDVIVLTETRSNAGTAALVDRLCYEGYEATSPAPPSAGERGVAVLLRHGRPHDRRAVTVDLGHRLIVETVAFSSPITVFGAYVPSRDASPVKVERKRRFLSQMLQALNDPTYMCRTIVMGDLNVIGRHHFPRYAAFRAWEYDFLDRVAALGFVDVFTTLHPGVQAHSWIGRTGCGYRYDYAFVSPDLVDSAIACEYLHEPRTTRLSDHAGVLLTVGRDAGPLGGERGLMSARAIAEAAAAMAL